MTMKGVPEENEQELKAVSVHTREVHTRSTMARKEQKPTGATQSPNYTKGRINFATGEEKQREGKEKIGAKMTCIYHVYPGFTYFSS